MIPDLEKILPMFEELIKELKILNESLAQLKEMIAPKLGWRVVEDKKK